MLRTLSFVSALAFAASNTAGGFAQTPSPAPSPAVTDVPTLQRVVDERTAGFSGSGLLLAQIGPTGVTMTMSGTSGTARPLDAHSLFEIGSVSKTFTATILASMVLDGSVKLDDPIAKYLPKSVHVPERNGKKITLLNLATQHSGLPRLPSNLRDLGAADPYARYTIADMYAFLSSYKLTRDPGATFEYSNYGVGLLGQVLAARAHTTYAELLRTRVLEPLGMNDTSLSLSAEQKMRLAVGRNADGDVVGPWTFQAIAPAGGIHSSIDDMLKYVRCNMGQGPLAKTCLFAQRPRSNFPGNRIGLVWWTGNVRHIVNHGGDTAGYHASVAIAPGGAEAVVALANGGIGVEDVALHALDPSVPVAQAPATITVDAATLDSYAGDYVAKDQGLTFTIARDGTALSARLTGQGAGRIFPVATDTFVSHIVDAKFKFARDDTGKPVALVLLQNGHALTFLRPGAVAPSEAALSPYPPIVQLDAQTLADYVGSYKSGAGTFVVTLDGGQLSVRLSDQVALPVFASAKDEFFYKAVDARITFGRLPTGGVGSLTLHQNSISVEAVRQP